MRNFFEELKRRHVIRVGLAYVVVGWLVLQFVDIVVPILELPDWIAKAVLLLLAIGLPLALLLAWALDLTPEGIKTAGQLKADETAPRNPGRTLDRIIIVALVIAVGYFAWDKFIAGRAPDGDAEIGRGASIAVLPFADMSPTGDQQYFAHGISEELLNLLAKTPNLKVAARTSSFQFEGRSEDVQKIGEQLGVDTILEGSVRKSGARLRITAQLVDTDEGFHIWSETYDRNLDDIFAVQDEIARAIVAALREKLGLQAEPTAIEAEAPTVNMEAHSAYLLGRHNFEKRTRDSLEQALESFRHAIELDPDYAPAWVGISNTYRFLSERIYGTLPHEEAMERARGPVERALELDPDLSDAHASLGAWYANRGNVVEAIPHLRRAVEVNPNNAQAWFWYGQTQLGAGAYAKAFDALQRAAALDPLSMIINQELVSAQINRGNLDAAERAAEKILAIDSNSYWGPYSLGRVREAQGRLAEAIILYRRAVALEGEIVLSELASALADIGLGEAAYDLLEDGPFEGLGDLFRGDIESAVAFARTHWPSSPDDAFAHGLRGIFELLGDDPAAAVSYFEKAREFLGSQPIDFRVNLAVAYRRLGEEEKAAATLQEARKGLQAAEAQGLTFRAEGSPNALVRAEFHAFEGRYDEAFALLGTLLAEGRLSLVDLKITPVFAGLREQPRYAAFLSEFEAWQRQQQSRLRELEAAEE